MTQLRRTLWLAVFAAAPFLLPSPAFAQSGTVTDDAFISSNSTTQFYNQNGHGISLIVAGSSATVGAAQVGTLKLYLSPATSPSGAIDIYSVTSPWSESTLTPSSQPTLASTPFATGINVGNANSFLVVDVTPLVKEWLVKDSANNILDNDGIALMAHNSSTYVAFDSKEDFITSHEPRLEVVLVDSGPPGPTGPPGPMGLQGPPGPMPVGAALTTTSNTFAGSQTINGNLILKGTGAGIQFGDGTLQTSAATGSVSGVPSGFMIFGTSATPPPGYTFSSAIGLGNSWAGVASMPTGRIYLAAAAVNGKVYAIGGIGNSTGALNTVEVYDPATDSWTTAAPMPTAREALVAVAVNGKIYAIGGNGALNNLNTVEVYDPATNSWTTAAPMPTGRFWMSAAAVNGKIYVIGGSPNLNTVEEYDPATNSWTTAAPMPTGRGQLAAAAVNGKIYAIGGNAYYPAIFNTVEEYDPATNSWNTAAPMSTVRFAGAAAAVNGKIYAISGSSGSAILNTVEVYNPATNSWVTAAPIANARVYLAAAEANGLIYAVGGDTDSHQRNLVERYSPPLTLFSFIKN
jgi:N-acetylneuraminic acid mutarotase